MHKCNTMNDRVICTQTICRQWILAACEVLAKDTLTYQQDVNTCLILLARDMQHKITLSNIYLHFRSYVTEVLSALGTFYHSNMFCYNRMTCKFQILQSVNKNVLDM